MNHPGTNSRTASMSSRYKDKSIMVSFSNQSGRKQSTTICVVPSECSHVHFYKSVVFDDNPSLIAPKNDASGSGWSLSCSSHRNPFNVLLEGKRRYEPVDTMQLNRHSSESASVFVFFNLEGFEFDLLGGTGTGLSNGGPQWPEGTNRPYITIGLLRIQYSRRITRWTTAKSSVKMRGLEGTSERMILENIESLELRLSVTAPPMMCRSVFEARLVLLESFDFLLSSKLPEER